MPEEGPSPGSAPRGRLTRAAAGAVGLFDSLGKIVGAIAGVVALAGALGFLTLGGGEQSSAPSTARTEASKASPPSTAGTPTSPSTRREQQVEKSEIVASATVPSLPRQDDARGANDYTPDNAVDGDIRTAWVEGVPGLAGGARLGFRLPHRVVLDRIRIVNGYAKSTAALLDNAAARTVLIRTDGMKGVFRRTLSRDSRPQSVRAAFGPTRRVTIEIVSAYPGDRFDDLAISEIWFFAKVS
jgi:hypothetical protein